MPASHLAQRVTQEIEALLNIQAFERVKQIEQYVSQLAAQVVLESGASEKFFTYLQASNAFTADDLKYLHAP